MVQLPFYTCQERKEVEVWDRLRRSTKCEDKGGSEDV